MSKIDKDLDVIFADPEVGKVLYAKGLIADANKSSTRELATITSLNPRDEHTTGYFYNNKVITQFPELKYCTGLTSLRSAFAGCSSLTTVGDIIPEGITNMTSTFSGCSSLIKAPIIPEGITNMTSTFSGCSSLTTVGDIIPSSVTILSHAFRGCSKLTKTPVIPEGVTEMRYTFYQCSSLRRAPIIPEGVTNLEATFRDCSSLITAPVLPSSVTNLGGTFNGCRSLTKAPVIPEGVTILSWTFSSCSNIDGIYIINIVKPPTYENTFYLTTVQAIYVPDDSVSAYKSASGWSDYASKIYPMSTKP